MVINHTLFCDNSVLFIRSFIYSFSPIFLIKRRICHYKIRFQIFVLVVQKSVSMFFSKICRNATNGKIHFCQFECSWGGFLPINRNFFFVSVVTFNKLDTLHKHTARTTSRVINNSLVRFNYFGNKFNNGLWCVEFSFSLAFGNCKLSYTPCYM